MFGVTHCGSGSLIPALSQVAAIGKTGTAEVAGKQPHGWLITQAPYSLKDPNQLPALTIVAMKENDGEGAYAVGPMTANDYQDIFTKNYVTAQTPPPADPNYCGRTGLLQ